MHFSFESFYQHILRLRDPFLGFVQPVNEHIRQSSFLLVFCSQHFLWILSQSFVVCLHDPSVLVHCTFFIRARTMLIIILFNSWSDDIRIFAVSLSGSDVHSVSSSCVCLLVCLVTFIRSHLVCWVRGTEVNGPLWKACGFLGSGYLLLAVAVGCLSASFPCVLLSVSLVIVGFP